MDGEGSIFQIRRARKSDMQVLLQLIAAIFPSARRRTKPGDIFLLAERGSVPVGFCHMRLDEEKKRCYIAGLGVLAHYREHGIGRRLMYEAVLFADKMGVETTTLKVRALNTASKLYLDFGFFERRAGDTLTLVRKKPS